jgi:hypothetical protein
VEAVPIREQEIADLVRDYGIAREYYNQLVQKKLSADTATQLEVRQKGEQFTILDPARIPEKPSEPNRPARYMAGALGGLGLGVALALVTEIFGMCITSAEQMATASGVPVLGTIPMLYTLQDTRRKRRTTIGVAAAAALLVLIGIALLYQFQDRIF